MSWLLCATSLEHLVPAVRQRLELYCDVASFQSFTPFPLLKLTLPYLLIFHSRLATPALLEHYTVIKSSSVDTFAHRPVFLSGGTESRRGSGPYWDVGLWCYTAGRLCGRSRKSFSSGVAQRVLSLHTTATHVPCSPYSDAIPFCSHPLFSLPACVCGPSAAVRLHLSRDARAPL